MPTLTVTRPSHTIRATTLGFRPTAPYRLTAERHDAARRARTILWRMRMGEQGLQEGDTRGIHGLYV